MDAEEPLPPDDLRCKRTDGRDWRCKRPALDGKSFCDSHLYRGQKKHNSSPSNPNPNNPNPNNADTPATNPNPATRLRIRVRVKPEPVEEIPNPVRPEPVRDELRCNRNDGRSWRCKRQVVEGQLYCERHCFSGTHLGRNSNKKGSSSSKRKAKMKALSGNVGDLPECGTHLSRNNKEKGEGLVPERLRCARNDGRDWRCKRRVVEGQSLCEVHFKKVKIKGPVNKNNDDNNVVVDGKGDSGEKGPVSSNHDDGVGVGVGEGEREKAEVSPKKRRRVFPPVPENERCAVVDGRGRCQRRASEGDSLCEVHLMRAEKSQSSKKNNAGVPVKVEPRTEIVPEPVLAKDKDNDKEKEKEKEMAMEKEKEKEKEKQKEKQKEKEKEKEKAKEKAKGSEKEKKKGKGKEKEKEKEKGGEEDHMRCKRTDGRGWWCKRAALEGKTLCEIHYEQGRLRQMKVTVPEAMKIKRGDGGGEKTEKRSKKKRELEALENGSDKGMKRMKADLISVFLRREINKRNKKNEKDNETSGEVTLDLPYGIMSIPPAPPTQFLDNAESLGVKVGVQPYKATVNRRFRSKNIEPPPIGSVKVVPYVGNLGKVKNNGRRKCHWCRRNENKTLTKCLTCRKRWFCLDCMKERCSDPQEIQRRCPVCRGSCDCKFCRNAKSKDVGAKEIVKQPYMGSKLQQLQYLINFLLPILVQINLVQTVEMEKEANFKGQNLSEVEIGQADVGCSDICCCNNCKSPILDFHRSCPNCSYNLCLSCCREYSQGGLLGGRAVANGRTKTIVLGLRSARSYTKKIPKDSSAASVHLSCPPMELGGCDNSLLDLRCIFPLNWTKELEISASEMVSECDFPQAGGDSVKCSICASISESDKSRELRESSRRKDSEDNFLYCPSASDDRDVLTHFQRHWQKSHPVKVHNVFQEGSNLNWDPLTMFCCYLEKATGNSENVDGVQTANCLDWYDVEMGIKESFTGSLWKGHTSKHRETLKLKAKLSSALSRKLFDGHFVEIIRALPFQEYTNPRTGLLNLAGKLPEDSKLGPHLCISCGSREEIGRGELVTKLCHNSYDVVNILVHADSSPFSIELHNKIKKLIRHSGPKENGGYLLQNSESGGTRMHSEILVEAAGQDRVLERNSSSQGATGSCSVAANDANLRDGKSPAKVQGSDTDSDASMICSGARDSPEKSNDQMSLLDHMESSSLSDKKHPLDSCGAQWDVFRRQDVPKLLEYIAKYADMLNYSSDLPKNVVHPIFDESFYLDATHKMRLKEEFDIEPWTFNQCLGEAVFIPAGCPFQIRNIKSCVNVVVGFVSPEHASTCIKLIDEIRLLPNDHKAKQEKLEVEKMTICSVDEAIKEMYRLKSEVRSQAPLP